MKLGRLVPVLLLALGVTPALVLGVSVLPAVVGVFDQAARQDSLEQAQVRQGQLTQALERRRERARNIALLPAPLEMLQAAEGGGPTLDYSQAAERFRAVMDRWFHGAADLRALAVVDRRGRERLRLEPKPGGLAIVPPAPGHGLGARFAAALAEGGDGGALTLPDGGLRIYQPIRSADGAGVGMLTVDYGLSATLAAAAAGSVWVDGAGAYLRGGDGAESAFDRYPMLRAAPSAPLVVRTASGRTAWVPLVLGPEPSDRLWIGSRLDEGGLERWLATLWRRAALVAAVLAVVLALLVHRVTRAVESIRMTALDGLHRIIAGEPDVHFAWSRPDELRQLGRDLTELGALHSSVNADLRRFTEILAHHLQEPVRMQAAYVQALTRLLPPPRSPEVEEAITYVHAGAVRLRELLRDAHLYLVLDRLPPPSSPVPAGEALRAAWAKLAARSAACGAVLEDSPLPEVWMPRARLVDLFGVLLANALEYRNPARVPHIRVGCGDGGGVWQFAVSDNGIGIEPQYAERIFLVFERLHSRVEHAGTGIGLALARKIVECAHGRIRVESIPGEGSTFLFTLPKTME